MGITFHFITVVWGDAYTNLFLDVVMPTQLSPGNLYAFADKPAVYKIYTTSVDADRIYRSDVFQQLKDILPVEVITDDEADLSKGFQVMMDFHNRAIREADECSAALVFLTPDSIWSDGSFLRLWELAQLGKRVVLSTGTRLTKETFVPDFLQRFRSNHESSVMLPPRELVRVAIPHLHPTTQSLFLNAKISNSWPSLLYWHAPDHGIVARCFHLHPIMINPSVKGIVPESSVDDDYIARVCPNPNEFYVIEDSDEMIGFEISSQRHLVGDMFAFEPTAFQVALWAYKFANDRHQKFVNHRIFIHTDDLSSAWHKTFQESDDFIQAVQHYLRTNVRQIDRLLYDLKPLIRNLKYLLNWFKRLLKSFMEILGYPRKLYRSGKRRAYLKYKPALHYTVGIIRTVCYRFILTRWIIKTNPFFKKLYRPPKTIYRRSKQFFKQLLISLRIIKLKEGVTKTTKLQGHILTMPWVGSILVNLRSLLIFIKTHPAISK